MQGIKEHGFTPGALTLRALARYPDRPAFTWDGGELSYRATADLIGRLQVVFLDRGLRRGDRVALLSANRVETSCAGVAAQLCGAATTALHPKGALADQESQLADSGARFLVLDPQAFAAEGAGLAGREGLTLFTLGAAEYGQDLLAGFDPGEMLATIEARRINMTLVVPTVLYMLLGDPCLALTRLGKIDKKALRARYWDGQGRSVG